MSNWDPHFYQQSAEPDPDTRSSQPEFSEAALRKGMDKVNRCIGNLKEQLTKGIVNDTPDVVTARAYVAPVENAMTELEQILFGTPESKSSI